MKHRKRRDLLGEDSPLDRPLRVTFFDDIAGKSLWTETHSIRQFAALVEDTVRPSKEDLLKVKIAQFGNRRSPKGSLRHDANQRSFDAGELDYDGGKVAMQEAADKFKAADVAALFFETPSSTPEKPRWRAIPPCSRPMQPEDRERLVARANGVLGGILAGESFSSSQFYYAGTVKGKRPKVLLVDGRYIDEAHDLDAGAIGKRKKDREAKAEHRENDDTDSAAAYRKGMQIRVDGGTREDLSEWVAEHPFKGYLDDPERAIDRIWERSEVEAGRIALKILNDDLGFEDLGPDAQQQGLKTFTAADIMPEAIKWAWPGRAALGKLTIIAGDPGQGKSQITLDMAARLTTGRQWPDGGLPPIGNVIILQAEDGAKDTTVPRLMAAGANLNMVHFIESTLTKNGRSRSFNLKDDIRLLEATTSRIGNVVAAIIDPITAYMGEVDSHRTSDVRAVLTPVAEWAERNGISVIAVSHPPKAAQAKAINAVTGSLAYVAAARIVLVAIEDVNRPDRTLLLPVKNNIAPKCEGLGYSIMQHVVKNQHGDAIETSAVSWDDEPVSMTADEAMNQSREVGRPAKASNKAEDFLRDVLAFGAVPVNSVKQQAKEMGISEATLRRASDKLEIVKAKDRFDGGWTWQLPESV